MQKTVLQRFEEKYIPEPNTGCWFWLAGLDGHGYGQFCFKRDTHKGKMMNAYKFAYEFFVKKVPKGLELDHLCRNKLCVNPDHLEPVTKLVNIRRGRGISVIHSEKTHCPKGHPYDEKNTMICNGARYCKKCNAEKAMRNRRSRGIMERRYAASAS